MTTILKSNRIQPSQSIHEIKKINLDGLDKNNYFHTTVFFGYSHHHFTTTEMDNHHEQMMNKIKKDISILQNDFPMIGGTVQYNYEKNDAHILYDGSGVVLIEAENNHINTDDLNYNHPDNTSLAAKLSDQFFPDQNYLKKEYPHVQHFPFILQFTKLKCHSIIFTLTYSHMVLDGTSVDLILKAWKSISKGLNDYIKPDTVKKLDYNEIKNQSQSSIPGGWVEIPKKSLFSESSTSSSSSQPTPSIRLHFSKDKINKYKEKLNNLIKKEDETKYVTSDEILCSILWKAVTKHRKLNDDDKYTTTTLARAINVRNKIKPMVSGQSFGNFATTYGVDFSLNDMLSLDDLQIIKKIQLEKELYNKDKIFQNLKYYAELPFDKALGMDLNGMAQNNLLMNSWYQFSSLSSFDIGFGNNDFVGVPPLANGVILIFPPCFNQKEGFIAHIFLDEYLLQELEKDDDILKYLY